MWRALSSGYFLSEIVPTDKPLYIEYLKEKEISDLTLTIPFPYEASDADSWLHYAEVQKKRVGTNLQWAIRDAKAVLVGGIGLSEFVPGEAHKAELGYWLAKPFWGKGIASEAVKSICDLAVNELGLIRITATIFAHNIASERVLQKTGFTLEATMKYHYYKNEMLVDGKLYARVVEPEEN